jgi:hypothetical protein
MIEIPAPKDILKYDEWRKKISLRMSGENNPMFGKHLKHTEETKKKISLRMSGKNNPMFGKPRSEESKKKISLSSIGKSKSENHKKKISESQIGNKNHRFGKHESDEVKFKKLDTTIGGIWFGAVTYPKPNNTCLLWEDVNKRSHAFYENRCVICGKVHKSNVGHHVFYERQACCMITENGEYYTNLNAKDHPLKDYYIGTNPNYFVILCTSCHGKTNGKFKNRKKWADYFKNLIDEQYGGKSFLTKEEYNMMNI